MIAVTVALINVPPQSPPRRSRRMPLPSPLPPLSPSSLAALITCHYKSKTGAAGLRWLAGASTIFLYVKAMKKEGDAIDMRLAQMARRFFVEHHYSYILTYH